MTNNRLLGSKGELFQVSADGLQFRRSTSSQQANEITKLEMITTSLQQDLIEIRKMYESACESRNYMGIQLIDRNDEL